MAIPGDKGIELDRFLEKVSTEELKRLLREELVSEDSDSLQDELLMAKITEVVIQRETQASIAPEFDAKAAWEEFKQELPSAARGHDKAPRRYTRDLPSSQVWSSPKACPKTPRFRSVLRRVAVAAALLALFMAGMVLAQAAGTDVFGRLARWTDEIFYFTSSQNTGDNIDPAYSAFQDSLSRLGISKDYSPTWCPEGFSPEEPQTWSNKTGAAAQIIFTHPNGQLLSVDIEQYNSGLLPSARLYEKDVSLVEEYISNGRTFYIFSNMGRNIAAWSSGGLAITIRGTVPRTDIKSIIDSLGGL